jgi:hypothetical protein
MKILNVIVICCFSLFLSSCACTSQSCPGADSCSSCASASSVYTKCNCVDPACSRSDTCLDRASCCEAFGNIGARADT